MGGHDFMKCAYGNVTLVGPVYPKTFISETPSDATNKCSNCHFLMMVASLLTRKRPAWMNGALACTDVYLWHTYKEEIHSA
jgi:hypothetical protein